jgi:hypothetical protein
MPSDNENLPIIELTELYGELEDSISRCRRIVRDCKSRLAANDENGSGPANDVGPAPFMVARRPE